MTLNEFIDGPLARTAGQRWNVHRNGAIRLDSCFCPLEAAAGRHGLSDAVLLFDLAPRDANTIILAADSNAHAEAPIVHCRRRMLAVLGLA